ncbi:MAG: 50S ribosomal protein L24 [Acidobacteriota bacterium]|nr:50S ribosomal protein L24 [Blastocatellia bacterium]MDW8412636.1 50S ribosomal protein L24 [Acidobacteriota bacterium]
MGLKALKRKNFRIKHVKKNDRVVILAGSDRGKQGRVIDVLPREGKVLVEGIALVKHHQRPNSARGITGGIVEKESYIDASNVMVISPVTGKPERGYHKKAKKTAK